MSASKANEELLPTMRTSPSRFLVPGYLTRHCLAALLALGLILGLSAPRAVATSVLPPEFDSLVSQADYIVHGVVQSVSSEWTTINGHKAIISKVTVSIKEVVAGTPPSTTSVVLQMLGGRVGEDILAVSGAPKFQVGDEDILFVQGNGAQVSPLVAMMYGRYPVVHTSSGDFIARNNGQALTDVKEVSAPAEQASVKALTAAPLTKNEFIRQIRASRQNGSAVSATKTQN